MLRQVAQAITRPIHLAGTALVAIFLTTLCTQPAAAHTESVLYSLDGSPNDVSANGPVVFDTAGNLYGTTSGSGGSYGGTVFELSPPSAAGGAWTESVIYSFTGGTDGSYPSGNLAIDKAGSLYGTTQSAGDAKCHCGVVFKLKPPSTPGGVWTQRTMHRFTGLPDGSTPKGGVILDSKGVVYGTTSAGGSLNYGTVFTVASSGSGFVETILYSFEVNIGIAPVSWLTFDGIGNLYGTASQGGLARGTAFKLAVPAVAEAVGFRRLSSTSMVAMLGAYLPLILSSIRAEISTGLLLQAATASPAQHSGFPRQRMVERIGLRASFTPFQVLHPVPLRARVCCSTPQPGASTAPQGAADQRIKLRSIPEPSSNSRRQRLPVELGAKQSCTPSSAIPTANGQSRQSSLTPTRI